MGARDRPGRIIHLIRNAVRFASCKYWEEMSRDLRLVYLAPSEAAARERFAEFDVKWGKQYPAISKLWENAWSEFTPLDYDVEIRPVICSTNAIESLNTRAADELSERAGISRTTRRAEVSLPRDQGP